MKTEFKWIRIVYILYRGTVRFLTIPLRWLPESAFKNKIRNFILRFQHSLPTEFAVNRGDTVVQIGTPWPKTMRRFRRAVGPNGRLVIVEAMPENQDRLEQAIAESGFDNILLIKGAAFSETKEGYLTTSPYKGDHKVSVDGIQMDNDLKPGNADMQQIEVQFHRLDEVLPANGVDSFDYLSITVNGAEAEVLKGAQRILEAARPGARVYAKGHALDAEGNPLHLQTKAIMDGHGFTTQITKGEPSSTLDQRWLWRTGDLFAWKPW